MFREYIPSRATRANGRALQRQQPNTGGINVFVQRKFAGERVEHADSHAVVGSAQIGLSRRRNASGFPPQGQARDQNSKNSRDENAVERSCAAKRDDRRPDALYLIKIE